MTSIVDLLLKTPGQLANVALGAPIPTDILPERDAEWATGKLTGGGIALTLSGHAPYGKVVSLRTQFTGLDDRARADALFSALRSRLHQHFGGVVARQTSRNLELKTADATVSLSTVRKETDDGAYDSVSLRHELDQSAHPAPVASDLGFDLRAAATALATKAFPVDLVEHLLVTQWARPDSEKAPEWEAVLAATASEQAARLPEVVEGLLNAASWVETSRWYERASKLLRGVMPRRPTYTHALGPKEGFTTVTQNDLFMVLSMLAVPERERALCAVQVYRALELGDEHAAAEVRARLKLPSLVTAAFDGSDEVVVRLFDLLAGGLGDLDRLSLPFRVSTANAALACVKWFAAKQGLRVKFPRVKTRDQNWKPAAESLAALFVLVRDHFPQHLEQTAAAFAAHAGLLNPTVVAGVGGAAGESISATVWQLGSTRFTIRGSNVVAAPVASVAKTAHPKPALKATKKSKR